MRVALGRAGERGRVVGGWALESTLPGQQEQSSAREKVHRKPGGSALRFSGKGGYQVGVVVRRVQPGRSSTRVPREPLAPVTTMAPHAATDRATKLRRVRDETVTRPRADKRPLRTSPIRRQPWSRTPHHGTRMNRVSRCASTCAHRGRSPSLPSCPLSSPAKWAFRREHTGGIDDVSHHHPRADRVAVADDAARLCHVGDSD